MLVCVQYSHHEVTEFIFAPSSNREAIQDKGTYRMDSLLCSLMSRECESLFSSVMLNSIIGTKQW